MRKSQHKFLSRAKNCKLKPWLKQQWCISTVSSEFVAAMEDVLDLYATPYDPKRPKVNFDESNKQLIKETRASLPGRPGQPERYDYEYERNGTRNIFLFVEPLVQDIVFHSFSASTGSSVLNKIARSNIRVL
jgi:hypothetical protein